MRRFQLCYMRGQSTRAVEYFYTHLNCIFISNPVGPSCNYRHTVHTHEGKVRDKVGRTSRSDIDIGLTKYQKTHSQNLILLFPFMTAHHTFHKKPRWAIVMAVILCRALTPSCRTTTCPWLNIDWGSFGPSGCPLSSLSSFLWLRTFRGR